MVFNFDMINSEVSKEMKPKVFERIMFILDNEKIQYDKKTIAKLVDMYYPNIRKIISLIQKYSSMNGVIDSNVFSVENIDNEFFNMILEKEFELARKYVIEKSFNYDEIYTKMYKQFVPLLPNDKKPNAIIHIGDYMHKHSFSIDPEINFACLLLELMSL
jgi:replication factor C small subunit